jgi:hypothetical protein
MIELVASYIHILAFMLMAACLPPKTWDALTSPISSRLPWCC